MTPIIKESDLTALLNGFDNFFTQINIKLLANLVDFWLQIWCQAIEVFNQ